MYTEILAILTPFIFIKLFHIRYTIFQYVVLFLKVFDWRTTVIIDDPTIVEELMISFAKCQHDSSVLAIVQHKEKFIFIPHNNSFIVYSNGRPFIIQHEEKKVIGSGGNTGGQKSILYISTFKKHEEKSIYNFVSCMQRRAHKKMIVFKFTGFRWRRETKVLSDELGDDIIDDEEYIKFEDASSIDDKSQFSSDTENVSEGDRDHPFSSDFDENIDKRRNEENEAITCNDDDVVPTVIEVRDGISSTTHASVHNTGYDSDIKSSDLTTIHNIANESPLILRKGIFEGLMKTIQEFISGREEYIKLGIPYRIGILLYGTPSSGKMTTLRHVARRLNKCISVLSLENQQMTDAALQHALYSIPENSLLLFTGIDTIFQDDRTSNVQRKLTFSGLLNALDGIATPEGIISFFIAHDISKVDPALIRPGRCDYKIKYEFATKNQIVEYFKFFYPNASQKELESCRKTFPGDIFPMKLFQTHFAKYRNKPRRAIRRAHEIIENVLVKDTITASSMTITEFLRRLGLSHFTKSCYDKEIYMPNDLLHKNQYRKILSTNKVAMSRVQELASNVRCMRFQYMSRIQLKEFLHEQFPDADDAHFRTLFEMISPCQVTWYQIMDLCHSFNDIHHCIRGVDLILSPPLDQISRSNLIRRVFRKFNSLDEFFDYSLATNKQKKIMKYLESEHIFTLKELIECSSKIPWKDFLSNKELRTMNHALSLLKKEF